MSFQPFDEAGEREEYRRHLPHWQQRGCTYFVTFRLKDALPHTKRAQWEEERKQWLRARGVAAPEKLPASERTLFHRHFNRQMHRWLDAGEGACVLREPRCAACVAGALQFFDGQRCALGSFVVMPNHVHVLVTPLGEWALHALLHSWKRHSAREINRLRMAEGSLWQDESFDHIVRSEEQLRFFRQYILENPMKARLREGEYLLGCGSDEDRGTAL